MSQGEAKEGTLGELEKAVSGIRLRGFSISVERWMVVAGAVLVAVGIPIIVAGWYGAAHTPYVFEQVPYLISGGLLGLALSLLGGLVYFAYWMTRQVQETRAQSDRTHDALMKIQHLLEASVAVGGAATAGAEANGAFVATEKGTMFHRPDCVVVSNRSDIRSVNAGTAGLEPCRICDPLGASV